MQASNNENNKGKLIDFDTAAKKIGRSSARSLSVSMCKGSATYDFLNQRKILIGRRIFFRESDLEEYIESRRACNLPERLAAQ